MKKFVFLLGAAMALTACSEDVYNDVENEEESMYSTNSFNDNNSGQSSLYPGSNGISFPAANYVSPWDIWYREGKKVNGQTNLQPAYLFTNGNADDFSPYDIEVFAYIGLAYFDSHDDGTYTDVKTGASYPLTTGAYPHLYPPTNPHEVGNLVRTPIPIVSDAYPAATSGLRLEDTESHLLMPGIAMQDRYPQFSQGQTFDFAGSITPQEINLLRIYGKVFFYEVHVYDKVTGTPVLNTLMHPKIETLPTGSSSPAQGWEKVTDLFRTNL